ncbi:MAG: hypothetical protein JWR42_2572 [Marmoricola sp.]|nr:hypothetical protein [Marmoricola sp.]
MDCTVAGREGLMGLGGTPADASGRVLTTPPRRARITVTAPVGARLSVAVDASPRRD